MASQISPLEKIHTGLWIDQAQGKVSGLTLTVTNTQGAYLIATLAIFVRIAAGHFWDILCWFWFHSRQTDEERDGLHHQHQALLRNNLTDSRAVWQFFLTAWAWRKRTRRPILRSLPIILAALIHFVAFAAAGVFSSRVASAQSNVLISGPTCGWLYHGEATDQAGLIQLAERNRWMNNIRRRSLTQSSSCHTFNQSETVQSTQDCKAWGRQFIPYTLRTNVTCPFAPEMCIDGLAVEFTTGVIDSTVDLGINAPKDHRVQMSNQLTCAPITLNGFKEELANLEATNLSSQFTDNGYPDWGGYLGYNYGTSLFPTTKYTWVWANYTFGWTFGDNIEPPSYLIDFAGYQDATEDGYNTFRPIPQLNTTDADVILFFIAQNSLTFTQPSKDPVFGATVETTSSFDDTNGEPHPLSLYSPSEPVTVMGCSQKWQFCNPINNTCSPWSRKMNAERKDLNNYNEYQLAVLDRMAGATALPEIGSLVSILGDNAILASAGTTGGSGGLPDDEWIRELDHWISTYWMAVQLFTAGYPVGSGVEAEDKYVTPPKAQDQWMCRSQIVQRNDYTSVNMLGILIIFCFGVLFMVINLTIDPMANEIRRMRARRNGASYQISLWRKHYTPHLLSAAFQLAGKGDWEQQRLVPVTKEEKKFTFSTNLEGGDEKFTFSDSIDGDSSFSGNRARFLTTELLTTSETPKYDMPSS